MSRKAAVILAVLVAIAVPVALGYASVTRGHRVYRYEIQYDQFPETDRPLIDALKAESGVADVEARHDADSLYLTVHTYQRFPSPDVFAICEKLGYKGQGGSTASVVRPLW